MIAGFNIGFLLCCHLGITDKVPTKSSLNANLKALKPVTLEAINRVFVGAAQEAKVETSEKSLRETSLEEGGAN